MIDYTNEFLISVIVPAYNAAIYIEKCVESICNQSYSNIEVILIDDGSTDSSGKICDHYAEKDGRVKVVHKNNGGVSSARNVGIEIATGDFLMFVDSDDSMELNAVAILMDVISNSDDIDFIVSSYFDVYSDNERKIKKIVEHDIEIDEQELNSFCSDNYLMFTTPWAKLYKTKIISDNGLRFDETVKYGEDMIFNMQYLKHTKHIKLINSPIYNYKLIVSGSSQTKYFPDMADFRIRTFEAVKGVVSSDCEGVALKFLATGLGHYGNHIYEKFAAEGIVRLIQYFGRIIPYRMLEKEFGTTKAIVIKKNLPIVLFLLMFIKKKVKEIGK